MREITDINIDGVTYSGTVEYMYMRLQAITANRTFCIGFITGSSNADIWGKYISQNKLIIQKGIDGKWTNFTSI